MSDPYTSPDFATAALITIDTQCDVLDGEPLEIVHIVRLYRPDGANVDLCRRQGVERGTRVLTPGTPGSQLAPSLLPAPDLTLEDDLLLAGDIQALGQKESVIYKPRWGAFYDTPLEEHLRASIARG